MHLLFLTDKLNIDGGGSNHSLDLLARSLTDRGIDVELVTVNVDGENVLPSSYPYTITETNLAGNSRVATVRTTLRALRQSDADLIHVFDPSFAPIAGLYARSADTPVGCRLNTYTLFCTNNDVMDGECYEDCTLRKKIAHAPGSIRDNLEDIPKFAFDDLLSPLVVRHVDRFFALSPAVRDVYAANGIPKSKVSIVPNFYDPAFVDSEGDPNFAIDEVSRLLYVGRLHRKKGVDTLIRAVDRLDDPPHVDIVGEGPHRTELEQLVGENHFDGAVSFHGWVDHEALPEYYRNADLFVHPGRWPEPFGRTILEALQCGCVPIVSDIGGPPWILDDEQLTFPPDDARALATKIEQLRGKDLTRVEETLPDQLEKFAPGRVIDQICNEYDKVSSENRTTDELD